MKEYLFSMFAMIVATSSVSASEMQSAPKGKYPYPIEVSEDPAAWPSEFPLPVYPTPQKGIQYPAWPDSKG